MRLNLADGDNRLIGHVTDDSVGSVNAALALAVELGRENVHPGRGETAELWATLAHIAARDVGAARVVEPHLDALAILNEADAAADADRTWGVFASEAPGTTLVAHESATGWTLSGTKHWCSLASQLDSALVTASGQLWAVDLHDAGVSVDDGAWHARGLVEIPSGPVTFSTVAAVPIGAPRWYLERSGFTWGGIGVAACWYGGAVGVARAVFAAAKKRPDDFVLMHLGAIDEQLESARIALSDAARLVDEGAPVRIVAKRVRATVARTVEDVLARAAHALGPAPLALDAAYAKRVADLQLYVRQHHAEKDLASLGRALTEQDAPSW